MTIKQFLPESICVEAAQLGAEHTAAQRAASSGGRLAQRHRILGNQELLQRIAVLRPEETAGQLASGERIPVAAVMSSDGQTVSEHIGHPGRLVEDAWRTELAMVAAGHGSIRGDSAILVQAADLFACSDAAACSRDITRDLGLLQALLPSAAQALESRLQHHAQAVLSDAGALASSAGVFALAADTGIRALAASSGVSAVLGAAATSTLHTAVRREVGARIVGFTAQEWAPEDLCSGFFRCFVDAWIIAFADAQKALEATDKIDGLQGLARWMRVLSPLQHRELQDHFQGAIIEPFLSMAAQTVPAASIHQHSHGSLSGVYNFTLVFTLAAGQVEPRMIGLPTALSAHDADLIQRLPGLWQSQMIELISADQDLILWVCRDTVTITKAELGAARDLQALGASTPQVLDELRLQAAEGDREAQTTLTAIEQRGAERLWDRLLTGIGPSSCIGDLADVPLLRRD